MSNARQILHSSESNEHYTPRRFLDAARAVLGGIDLDPASSPVANTIVRAANYYTADEDGIALPWHGRRVWLNPPYGRRSSGKQISNAGLWATRALLALEAGEIEACILLVNAVPGNQWYRPLLDYPICYPPRIRFLDPVNLQPQTSPTNSNAIVLLAPFSAYLGGLWDTFARVFSTLGTVTVRATPGYADPRSVWDFDGSRRFIDRVTEEREAYEAAREEREKGNAPHMLAGILRRRLELNQIKAPGVELPAGEVVEVDPDYDASVPPYTYGDGDDDPDEYPYAASDHAFDAGREG